MASFWLALVRCLDVLQQLRAARAIEQTTVRNYN
jgi:hypothetical protein